jgi:hypothetical protein
MAREKVVCATSLPNATFPAQNAWEKQVVEDRYLILIFSYLPPKSKVRFFGARTAICVGIGHQTVLYHPISIITLSNKK